MNRRAILVGALLLIVLGASYSTARARQVWSENQARSLAAAAQQRSSAALDAASSAGLLAGELAPLVQKEHTLSHQQPPSSLPFWSVGVDRFYRQQAAEYDGLTRQVRAEVQRVTHETRAQARQALSSMKEEIGRATALDLHPSSAARALETQQPAFTHSTAPRQYRSITSSLAATQSRLEASVRAREHYVSGVLTSAGGSRDGVLRYAEREVAGAEGKLPLLGLLTSRADRYRVQLAALQSAVSAQPTAQAAAAAEYAVHRAVASVVADYARTVPSKMIVVSTEAQSATLYQDGRSIMSTPVTTGGPELPTDHGVFHIYMKISPFTFHSPWPPGSPYYYPPTNIQYWMPFDGAEGLHDAWWRTNFGPGSNYAPTDLGTGNTILGTHGCVNLPADAAQFVWNWAPVGTTVVVI